MDIDERLGNIERMLSELLAAKAIKEWYTTAEVANALNRAEYTVREWCRQGRVKAGKRVCGHGKSKEWIVSHGELIRLRNEGLLPLRAAI